MKTHYCADTKVDVQTDSIGDDVDLNFIKPSKSDETTTIFGTAPSKIIPKGALPQWPPPKYVRPPPIKAKIEVTRRPFPTTSPTRQPPTPIRTLPSRPSPNNIRTPPLR